MRVVKDERPCKETIARCQCCQTVFAYSEKDVEYENDYIFFVLWRTTRFVKCPGCGTLLTVK